jgi:hypothetical protein
MPAPVEYDAAAVRRLVIETLPVASRENPRIFGSGGSLDSLGLVNLLSDLEYRLPQKFGRQVVLASERAMSRSHSPFRDVDALTEYILELLAE